MCRANGPGRDMFESTKIIGEKQFEKADSLFQTASKKVEGPLGWVHQFVDMSAQQVLTEKGNFSTCKPAMGYSFAAGTTDGLYQQETRV